MVLSCLVEPLVSPLIERGTGAHPGRRRGRLAATALVASALLMAASSMPTADDLNPQEEKVVCNAHKKPDPISTTQFLAELTVREDEVELKSPALAPDFEWDAIFAHRLRHSRDIVRDTGPGLSLGARQHRTLGADATYSLFSSGRHLVALI